MRKGILPSIVTSALFLLLVLPGCKKDNTLGVDNDKIVKFPYSLYMADSSGAVINTTDGTQFNNVFPPDGFTHTLLCVSGDNLLMLKNDLFFSVNGIHDFNPVLGNLHVRNFPWQTMIYDYQKQGKVYITSMDGKGISYSTDHGVNWRIDSSWVPDNELPPTFTISSFSGLSNGDLFAYSNVGNILFKKGISGNDTLWKPVQIAGSFIVNTSDYYLVSSDNTLFLVDYNGIGGVWYSTDEGIHWIKFSQGALPSHIPYYCAISPSGGTSLLVGTQEQGIFRTVNNGSFQPASGGLTIHNSVLSFTKKANTFKNDAVKQYIYAAASDGLYRSENDGNTWYTLTKTGVWKRAYVALY